MRRFLIDTDTASDDAVAIVMALRHPDVTVEALTVVAGNVGLDQGTSIGTAKAVCGFTIHGHFAGYNFGECFHIKRFTDAAT
jgi:purine nucleosidase